MNLHLLLLQKKKKRHLLHHQQEDLNLLQHYHHNLGQFSPVWDKLVKQIQILDKTNEAPSFQNFVYPCSIQFLNSFHHPMIILIDWLTNRDLIVTFFLYFMKKERKNFYILNNNHHVSLIFSIHSKIIF